MAAINNMEEEYNLDVGPNPIATLYFAFIGMFMITYTNIINENNVCILLMIFYCATGYMIGDIIRLNTTIDSNLKLLKEYHEDSLIGKIMTTLQQ